MASVTRDVIVLVGGDPVPGSLRSSLPPAALVIAADSGLHLAAELGLRVHVVVGDLDSVDPRRLAEAEAAGASVDRHPTDKDATDTALALNLALAHGPSRITVLGGAGGRIDHELALWSAVTAEHLAPAQIRVWSSRARTTVLRPDSPSELHGRVGDLLTLLAFHGTAREVTTSGLVYPLRGEDLDPGSTRGVSNRFALTRATVTLTDGVLLAIRPLDPGPLTDTTLESAP